MPRAALALALMTLAAGCGARCPDGTLLDGDGRCAPLDAGSDAGGDAGARDAGARDARDVGAADSGGDEDVGAEDVGADVREPCGGACSAPTPVCFEETCVECGSDTDCAGTDRCAVAGHTCVECLGDAGDACPVARPACRLVTNECVECLSSADCASAGAPVCDTSANECVECLASADCRAPGASVCDTSASECVECLASADCRAPGASVCDLASRACEPCDAAGECAHLPATSVCDLAASTCVECLSSSDCAPTEGCELALRTCRPFTPASAGPCSPCVRDAECGAGQLCVPMTYDDPTTGAADPVPAGNHCLWRQDAAGPGAPGGDCATIRPYVRGAAATSVDGTTATVCTLRVSTCESQAAFSMLDCMTLDAAGDARCGQPGLHDGVCRMAGPTTNRCSVFCGSSDDCRGGFSCDTGASPSVCLF